MVSLHGNRIVTDNSDSSVRSDLPIKMNSKPTIYLMLSLEKKKR